MGSFVVGTGDCPELLLPSRIPYLQLNNIPVDRDGSDWRDEYLNLKSTPIVVRWLSVNLSSVNLCKSADLPTDELPTITILNK